MSAFGHDALRVLGLVCGYPRAVRVGRTIVFLRGFFDDSGSNANEPYCVLGGLVAPVEAWLTFADEWRNALNGPPKLDYFKMNEAHRLKGQFEGWDEPERDDRVLKLAEIAAKHASLTVGVLISRPVWEGAMARFRKLSPLSDQQFPFSLDPYFILFYELATVISEVRRQIQWGEDCDYVFDNQGALGDRTAGFWGTFLDGASDNVRQYAGQKPTHADDKIMTPLQAADLYAWQVRRWIVEGDREPRRPALQAFGDVNWIVRPLSAQHVNNLVDAVIKTWISTGFLPENSLE